MLFAVRAYQASSLALGVLSLRTRTFFMRVQDKRTKGLPLVSIKDAISLSKDFSEA
jgi:hypothetical protein